MSIVGELLAQFTNQGVDVWHAGPIGAFVEEEVGRWLCDLVGYGPASFGILTSGGVMANLMAMTVARDVQLRRILGLDRPPRGRRLEGVRVYASDQTHFSIARALDELGFPPDTLHLVPADDASGCAAHRSPRRSPRIARRACVPWAISAVAGSTNTGSVDLTEELADRRRARGPVAPRRRGVRRWRAPVVARSVARARTWTGPTASRSIRTSGSSRPTTSAGCSSAGATTSSTSTTTAPEYYRGGETIAAGGAEVDDARRRGRAAQLLPALARGHAPLAGAQAVAELEAPRHGGLGRLVEANDDLAAYLARRCAEADDFEALPAEPELSVVCFRHLPGGAAAARRLAPAELDAHQDRIQAALVASGDGWLGTTLLRGATWLRAGIVNYLATEADIDRILDDLRRLARHEPLPDR